MCSVRMAKMISSA